ncbi:hypothetical protein SPHV1_520057 [Novosphingobium sp. KN65.2]|nr:hypothetical protein SPHV1_520057 [Novosphingobium sp. KN65.2]
MPKVATTTAKLATTIAIVLPALVSNRIRLTSRNRFLGNNDNQGLIGTVRRPGLLAQRQSISGNQAMDHI